MVGGQSFTNLSLTGGSQVDGRPSFGRGSEALGGPLRRDCNLGHDPMSDMNTTHFPEVIELSQGGF